MRIIDSVTDEELIAKYGFEVMGIKPNYETKEHGEYPYGSLEKRDDDEYGLGLSVWWADRNVKIIFGEHKEYGCCCIPKTLVKMIQDNILEEESE